MQLQHSLLIPLQGLRKLHLKYNRSNKLLHGFSIGKNAVTSQERMISEGRPHTDSYRLVSSARNRRRLVRVPAELWRGAPSAPAAAWTKGRSLGMSDGSKILGQTAAHEMKGQPAAQLSLTCWLLQIGLITSQRCLLRDGLTVRI